MRMLLIATAVVALTAGAPGAAQTTGAPEAAQTLATATAGTGQTMGGRMPQVRTHIPRGGWTRQTLPNRPSVGRPHMPRPTIDRHSRPQSRWGGQVGGRWHGGVRAPGGWNAYRRPSRGWTLPSYWYSPGFFVGDYASYGLGAPPQGHNWSRYYDDAVLVDGRGQVYDSVGGVEWDRSGDDYAYDETTGYDGYAGDGYGADYQSSYRERRDDGVGGAVIGGVLGGVAGNVIAGRGDKLGGTLIGAGVGAIAGAAIDQAEDRGRYREEYRDERGYRGPRQGPGGYPPASHHGYDGRVYHHGGYWQGGTYYAGGVTVTVQPTVTTTTTTTEYIYDAAPARHKRVYRAKPRARSCCSKTLSR